MNQYCVIHNNFYYEDTLTLCPECKKQEIFRSYYTSKVSPQELEIPTINDKLDEIIKLLKDIKNAK